jgi:hypothetical protein
VRAGAVRIWDEPNIALRGEAWELFDAQRTGFLRLPRGTPVFDQLDDLSGTAVSNKTLDLVQRSYSRSDRNAVFNTLAGYVDHIELALQGRVRGLRSYRNRIRSGRLHVLMPADEMLPGQELQIAAAQSYAESRGIVLHVEYAR